METEKIVLSGSPIEIAEYEDHKMATFLISVLDEYDLNGRMIPKESGELYHSSIVGFPILAKMVCNEAGDPVDFAGHEMYVVKDELGNIQVRFDTHPIGSVVESWIEEREVAGYVGKKYCIMIKAKLWSTRYPQYFAVLDKLWTARNVKSSWELTVQEAVQTAKGRILKAFSFIGNTLLGSSVIGAVPGAGVYEYAQADSDFELAAALSKDICLTKKAQRKEDGVLENENIQVQEQVIVDSVDTDVSNVAVDDTNVVDSAEIDGSAEVVVDPEVAEDVAEKATEETVSEDAVIGEQVEEIAALTVRDLRRKIEAAYRSQFNKWGWIAFWFPAENEAWIEDEERDNELEYVKIIYSVQDDNVIIGDTQSVVLTVSVSEINNTLNARDDAIMKANEKINDLSAQIASLQPYKDAADEEARIRAEAETAEKRKAFREKMIASKLFTDSEIETSDALKAMINSLDECALKSEIAERFMAKLVSEPAEPEVAEVNKNIQERVERVNVDDGDVDNNTFMRIFLGRN